MSETSHSSTWKVCATCEYWAGARTPDTFQSRVTYDQRGKGRCLGKWKGHERTASDTCSGWTKWAVMK